ncbi:class II fructose-bisphosphate aldolase [Enterococcus avium]|jgi:ketose-bisphosphate aldolase|uniref:class II fructose-bisphosphate aldolase n=1 Tax=Enterococcus avium TaxID=33945 RepID=UPI0032E3C9B5
MLVTSEQLFKTARRNKFAIPAPNFFNDLSLKTYLKCASERKLPIIVSFAESHRTFMEIEEAAELGKYYGEKAEVPVVLHLDHGMTYEYIVRAVKAGFTSVMIDASSDSYQENVKKTQEIVKVAHACGVVVEAEIGHVGSGENYENHDNTDSIYTNVDEALSFVRETHVDSLAISIGTAHGLYKGQPDLSFETLKAVYKKMAIPLVLHGGSSSGDDNLKQCAIKGISKINIFTDIAEAGIAELKRHTPTNVFEVNEFISKGMYDCLDHYYDVFETNKFLT